MSVNTKIQWCDSTCNPTMGCEGCELWNPKTGVKKCYAGVLHARFGGVTKGYSPTFDELTYWPGRMAEAARWSDLKGIRRKDKPWLDGLPRLVFVSDMSDALSAAVPFDFLKNEIVAVALSAEGRRHHWLWLTKRPDRMAQLSESLRMANIDWPENLWAGTSITTQGTTSRIRSLMRVGGDKTIRFLSVEPQHEKIDLSAWLPQLDWVIQGGESGRGATPFRLEWAHELIRQCRKANVAYFLKQLGSMVLSHGQRISFVDNHAGDWSEWPNALRVREMPQDIAHYKLTSSAGGRPITLPVLTKGNSNLPVLNRLEQKRRNAALKAWKTRRTKAGKATSTV